MSDEQEITTVYQQSDKATPGGDGASPKAAARDTEALTETRAIPTTATAGTRQDRTTGGSSGRPGIGQQRDRTGKVRVSETGAVRPARKARLRISKLDPWSMMKTALMFSVAAAIILFVAVALLWSVIEASGALTWLQDILNSVLGSPDGTGNIDIGIYIDRWRVMGFTAIVCGINVILLTALATLGAFLYNLSSSVLGGLEVTLAED